MDGYLPFALLIIGVFAGTLVSGFAGFAFSAVVGAFLVHRRGGAEDGVQRDGAGHEPCDRAQQPIDQSAFRQAMLAILLAMAMVSTLAGGARAQEDGLETDCRNLLHSSAFDCGCTAKFLGDHLRGEHADIMLRLWAYGVNGDTRRSETHDLYLHYGSKTISDAVMNFHRHRDLLRRYCAHGDGPAIAD